MKDTVQVRFNVNAEAAEAVTSLLTQEALGIEQRDTETSPLLPLDVVELTIWIPASSVKRLVWQVETLLKSLKELGTAVSPWSWSSQEVNPSSWKDAYKQFFRTFRIGKSFVIKPSWETYSPLAHDLVMELDPSMAFGTGLHASTRLTIHILERLAFYGVSPQTVLDMGCGTGILSIAAGKLWPSSTILSIDFDEHVVDICKANIKHNKLQERIKVEHRSAFHQRGYFDLVLANLTADLLTELQPKMHRLLKNEGFLVLSGLITEQAKDIAIQYCKNLICEPEYSEELDGWRALLIKLTE